MIYELTNKLRYIERKVKDGSHYKIPPTEKVLQQWYRNINSHIEDGGEWRDVELKKLEDE